DGLIEACEKYKVCMGIRFSTYATPWIKQRIRLFIPKQYYIVRLPGDIITLTNKFNRKRDELIQDRKSPRVNFDEVSSLLELKKAQKMMVYQALICRSEYKNIEKYDTVSEVETGEIDSTHIDLSVLDDHFQRE